MPGVRFVLTAADLGEIDAAGPDLPLAGGRVFYAGQPVAAVLADTEAAAADGAALVEVEYEPLPTVADVFSAMADSAPQVLPERSEGFDDVSIHGGGGESEGEAEKLPRNVSSIARSARGDVGTGFAEAEVTIEGRWFLPGAHQGFIEPHVAQAEPEEDGVVLHTPTQGHRFARDEVSKLLGLPLQSVRVVSMPVGGGFGGKVVLLEPLVAALARSCGRPVRLALTRSEEFQVGRGAPACHTDLKLGARRDGTLVALQVTQYWDNGAASGWHGGISSQLFSMAYTIPHLDFKAYEVATNKTPVDAYRAPGGTQVYHALESALDELAAELGMDPIELRLKNVRAESGTAVLEAARSHPLLGVPLGEGEGVGVALGVWGGAYGPANAGCRLEPDGSLTLQLGSVDISGSSTGLAMVAAAAFGVPVERVRVQVGDTGSAPQAPVAGGSAITYSVAPAVQLAALEARRQVLELAAERLEAAPEDLELVDGTVSVKGVPGRSVEVGEFAMGGTSGPPVLGLGRVRIDRQSPAFTVHLCRVRVDRETGELAVTGYAAVQDVGSAINPPEVEGQVHGGVTQGLGRALGEQMLYVDGQLRTGTLLDYEIPAADQVPEIDVQVVEVPSGVGLNTRGVGEPPAVPGPAAVANAVARATGVRVRTLPIDRESLIRR